MKNSQQDWRYYGLTARAASVDDVDTIVDLINAAALADTGRVGTTRADKLNEWGLPQFSMESDTLLLLAPDGQATAFAELWDSEPHVFHHLWGRVHPEWRGQGIGSHLMDWAEGQARQRIGTAPQEARVSLVTGTNSDNEAAHLLFKQHGFAPVRHFFKMLIEMAHSSPPPTPVWPEGIMVRPFVLGQDDRAIHRTIEEAFQDHWGYVVGESFEEFMHWIENDPTFDPSVCFLAVTDGSTRERGQGEAAGEEIAGALMARPEWEEDSTVAWIDELGVLRPWRKKGIALALLHQVFGEFHCRGRYKVGLGVDGESLTGATRLYEKAGMQVIQQIDVYDRVLRPGKDLSRRTLEEGPE